MFEYSIYAKCNEHGSLIPPSAMPLCMVRNLSLSALIRRGKFMYKRIMSSIRA